jgi:hypothetical protein
MLFGKQPISTAIDAMTANGNSAMIIFSCLFIAGLLLLCRSILIAVAPKRDVDHYWVYLSLVAIHPRWYRRARRQSGFSYP